MNRQIDNMEEQLSIVYNCITMLRIDLEMGNDGFMAKENLEQAMIKLNQVCNGVIDGPRLFLYVLR